MSGTQGGPEQELRWQNTDMSFTEKQKTSQANIRTDFYIPTKSLWPVASMLFRLMSLKFSSADEGAENSKPLVIMKLHAGGGGKINMDNHRRTSPQQLPVNVKWCPSHGATATTNIAS